MQNRDMDPSSMGLPNVPGIDGLGPVQDDDGSTIRSQNFANLLPGQTGGMTKEQIFLKNHGNVSSCVLIQNMFDPKTVNLKEEPDFFIEIKN